MSKFKKVTKPGGRHYYTAKVVPLSPEYQYVLLRFSEAGAVKSAYRYHDGFEYALSASERAALDEWLASNGIYIGYCWPDGTCHVDPGTPLYDYLDSLQMEDEV